MLSELGTLSVVPVLTHVMSNLIDEKLGFAQDLLDCCTVPEKLPVDQEFLKPLRGSLKINPLQDEVGSTRSGNEMFGQKGLQLFESLVKDTPVILVDFVFTPTCTPRPWWLRWC